VALVEIATDTPQASANNRFLYFVVFISGMTTLAVELTASRLLGYVFGTSNIVWANVIGLMLLYLTVGYFIGGRWADRSPRHTTLYTIIIWAAFLSALIPLISRPILQTAARAFINLEAALALGSFVSVVVLFAVPVTLLGTVSPFAIRLAVTDIQDAGRVSGQIYAMSTIGSIIGTFLPVLYLIPSVGTTYTFLIFGGVLYAIGFIGLWRQGRKRALIWAWMPLVVAVLAFIVIRGTLRPPNEGNRVIHETESAYNYIQVQEDTAGFRYLSLNDGQGVHSIWHPEQVYYRGTWDFFLTAPYFNADFSPSDLERVLVLGLATGTVPRQHIEVYGDLPIDGVEIDPEIIKAGAEYFEMNETHMPSLTTYAQDGRYVLNQLDGDYTVIGIDAYRPPYIPWHMTTVEFFQEVSDHLADDGVAVINVGRTATDRRLVAALGNTMSYVFPSVHTMDVPASFNTIIVATKQPTSADNLAANLAQLPPDAHPLLVQILQDGTQALVETVYNDILFTDDRAPVETITDSLVLNFLVGGGTESLR
jgi:spermidine synthase